MFLKHDWPDDNFTFYNGGIPFDTIPAAIFEYDVGHFSGNIFIGDINGDSNQDIVTACFTEDGPHYLPMYLRVYSMIATGIDDENIQDLPSDYRLLNCYPNPFNSTAIISFTNLKGGEINIYDISGRLVRSFMCDGSGEGSVIWDATDNHSNPITSGAYFVIAKSRNTFRTAKLIYLK